MRFNPTSSLSLLLDIVLTFATVVGVGWVLWRLLQKSDDPPRLIFKWILTVIILGFLGKVVVPIVAQGGYGGAFAGIPLTGVSGLALAIIWRHNIASLIAKPFASLYDGGDVEAEPRPFYSSALAKRKRGDFYGAKADIRVQLEKFPTDFEGQMLLAELEAQDLHDLNAAAVAVERLIAQKLYPPPNIAYALNSMADWHLKYGQDPAAAEACFRRLIELLPGSEWALRAEQRIAHLTSRDMLNESNERRRLKVVHIEGDPGLEMGKVSRAPQETDPADRAAQFVRHLEQFPYDTEVREQLARLYADHFQRLDLAQDQLEQLIQYPNQPAKQVVRWLNILADLQVKHGASYETVRATLQRIIDLYPDAASAQVTQNRIELLRLEFKGKEKSQAVTLGSYETDLGLKPRLPDQL